MANCSVEFGGLDSSGVYEIGELVTGHRGLNWASKNAVELLISAEHQVTRSAVTGHNIQSYLVVPRASQN